MSNEEHTAGGWRPHVGAIVTGAAAVAAAALAAYFPSAATRDVVRQQSRQIAEQHARDGRGAARVLASEFLVAGNEITDWAMNGTWARFGRDFPIQIPGADLRLIASEIKPRKWIWVQAGLNTVVELERYAAQRASKRSRFRGLLLSRHAVRIASRDLAYIGKATRSLWTLAGVKLPYRTLDAEGAIVNLREISRETGVPIADD